MKAVDFLLPVAVKMASFIYKIAPKKKKYDCIIVFAGNLGDFLLCRETFRQLSRDKKVLVFLSSQHYKAVPEIVDGLGDIEFVDTTHRNIIKDFHKLAWKKKADVLLQWDPCELRQLSMLSGLLCAKKKVKCTFGDAATRDATLKIDKKVFNKRIDKTDLDKNCSLQFTEAINETFQVDYQTKIADFRGVFGKSNYVDQPYFVLNIGVSGFYLKTWSAEKFAELSDYCAQKTGLLCVIMGQKADIKDAEFIAQKCKHRTLNLAGKTTLRDLFDIIADAKFVIGNDTGSTHIAASCGVKGFSILSEMYGSIFLPYPEEVIDTSIVTYVNKKSPCRGCIFRLKQTDECLECVKKTGHVLCVEQISVSDAIEVLENSGILCDN